MTLNISLRPGTVEDLPFLREMLFEAAYWRANWEPDQEKPTLEEGLARHDLAYLLEDWGREGDTAVIAIANDKQPVGAVWYRFWWPEQHSYGYISPQIPELAIAIRSEFRGLGIGGRLLATLLKTAADQGIEQISLSVEVGNPARNLYLQYGFEPVQKNQGDWVMVASTKNSRKFDANV